MDASRLMLFFVDGDLRIYDTYFHMQLFHGHALLPGPRNLDTSKGLCKFIY